MDNLLMLRGIARHCDDCATDTVFIPVAEAAPEFGDVWICTACDDAIVLPGLLSPAA